MESPWPICGEVDFDTPSDTRDDSDCEPSLEPFPCLEFDHPPCQRDATTPIFPEASSWACPSKQGTAVSWTYEPETPSWIQEVHPVSNMTFVRSQTVRSASEPNLARRKHYVLPTLNHPNYTDSDELYEADMIGKARLYPTPPRPKTILREFPSPPVHGLRQPPPDCSEKTARFAHLAAVHPELVPADEPNITWQTIKPPGPTAAAKFSAGRGRRFPLRDCKSDDEPRRFRGASRRSSMITHSPSFPASSFSYVPASPGHGSRERFYTPSTPRLEPTAGPSPAPSCRFGSLPFRPPTPPCTSSPS